MTCKSLFASLLSNIAPTVFSSLGASGSPGMVHWMRTTEFMSCWWPMSVRGSVPRASRSPMRWYVLLVPLAIVCHVVYHWLYMSIYVSFAPRSESFVMSRKSARMSLFHLRLFCRANILKSFVPPTILQVFVEAMKMLMRRCTPWPCVP